MRILLFGKDGQLGWELQRCLAPLGPLRAVEYPEINLLQPESARSYVREYQPQVIINATAYTAVDRAESEPQAAEMINAVAPGIMAEEARALGAVLVHYSTDYVFDGMKGSPYVESDPVNPVNVYGQSKLDGERVVQAAGCAYLVLRTCWLYSLRRGSFVTKALEWARSRPQIRLVTDQVGSPTWARMLAEITALALSRAGSDPAGYFGERSGVYHLAGSGACSRKEWGEAVLRLDPRRAEQVVESVLPALSSEFPTPARRPLYSALNCQRFEDTFDLRLPDWELALSQAMETG